MCSSDLEFFRLLIGVMPPKDSWSKKFGKHGL